MPSPKKNLNNLINIDNNETLPVPSGTSLEEIEARRKEKKIALALKNTQNANEQIIEPSY